MSAVGWIVGVLAVAWFVLAAVLFLHIAVTSRPSAEVIERNRPRGPEWLDQSTFDPESGHYLAATCPCQPTVEYVNGGIAVTHKATFDATTLSSETVPDEGMDG